MSNKSTRQTRSKRRKPKVTRQFPNSAQFGLEAGLKGYVDSRPGVKYAEEIAAKVVDLETDTGVYAELYRAYAHPCLSKIFVPSVCMVLTMFLLLMLGSLGSF